MLKKHEIVLNIVFWGTIFGGAYYIVSSEKTKLNKEQELINQKNIELNSQQFEIKEIYTQKFGNKNANSYITYQCITENVNNKTRVIALFDEGYIPIVGDIWKLQVNGYIRCNNQFRYKLYQRIK